jgi:hypothetical protein
MIDKLIYIIVIILIIVLIKVLLDNRKGGGTIMPNIINKVINPNPYYDDSAPERVYLPENSYSSKDFQYTLMGYADNGSGIRVRLYGRKDPDNRRLYQYYIKDENDIKIQLAISKELMDNEEINIPQLGGSFKAYLYDIESSNFQYDPNLF